MEDNSLKLQGDLLLYDQNGVLTSIYSGNAPPTFLLVNSPYPLWSGAFDTRQMVFVFDKNPKSVSGDFYQLTATFEGCPPVSDSIPSG